MPLLPLLQVTLAGLETLNLVLVTPPGLRQRYKNGRGINDGMSEPISFAPAVQRNTGKYCHEKPNQ